MADGVAVGSGVADGVAVGSGVADGVAVGRITGGRGIVTTVYDCAYLTVPAASRTATKKFLRPAVVAPVFSWATAYPLTRGPEATIGPGLLRVPAYQV